MTHSPDPIIRIGISSCLLGEKVRYDGGHKLDTYLTKTLGRFFEWVSVCPEAETGFGTPREAMHLERIGGKLGLWTVRSRMDLTARMKAYAAARVETLYGENLSGYILKSNSPSCGLTGVRVHEAGTGPARTGRGLFADALLARFPCLPVEEDDRLCDLRIRENWIQRVFAYYRLNRLWESRWTLRKLEAFQAEHKLMLLSHSPQGVRKLGHLVAQAKYIPRQMLKREYESHFMRILSIRATPGRHANVLQHAAGYLKELLDAESRRELHHHIEDYRRGNVPRVVPLALIRHYLGRFDVPYLAGQAYLHPYPRELALENHA